MSDNTGKKVFSSFLHEKHGIGYGENTFPGMRAPAVSVFRFQERAVFASIHHPHTDLILLERVF